MVQDPSVLSEHPSPPSQAASERSKGFPRRYDVKAIARYYNLRPWQTLWRSLQILWCFGWFVFRLQWDRFSRQAEANRALRAMQLRKLLTRLGPTFIKVGQALSTRPDLIHKDFLAELILLQDRLPPFDNDDAFDLIESELGQSIAEIYRDISPQPVAAASLGQVYHGHLWNGDEVAIKVQRPNLVPQLTLDLYLIRMAAILLGPWLPLNLGHDLSLIVDEFGTKLFEEIDYINEGRNAERFARNFQDHPEVKVPAVYWRYSGTRVLTLEWINGMKLTAMQCVIDANLSPDDLVRTGVISGLRQLLEFGFFHADPHPGNLFCTP